MNKAAKVSILDVTEGQVIAPIKGGTYWGFAKELDGTIIGATHLEGKYGILDAPSTGLTVASVEAVRTLSAGTTGKGARYYRVTFTDGTVARFSSSAKVVLI